MQRSYETFFMMTVHMILSCSSFIFKVPMERVKGYSVIWKEMQIHNCVFVLRAYLIFLLMFFNLNNGYTNVAVITFTHLLADFVTKVYGSQEMGTTIRGNKTLTGQGYWEKLEDLGIFFSSAAQIYAIYVLITCQDIVAPLLTMIPIQLSSLFGTLVRKGLISSFTNNTLYVTCIAIPIILKYHWTSICIPCISALVFIRFKLIGNHQYNKLLKYTMWITFAIIYETKLRQLLNSGDENLQSNIAFTSVY